MDARLALILFLTLLAAGCSGAAEESDAVATRAGDYGEYATQAEGGDDSDARLADDLLIEPISIEPLDDAFAEPDPLDPSPSAISVTAPIGHSDDGPRRPADYRPVHNDTRLAEFGIHRYESERLRLYTDIDPTVAETLPEIVDQVYPAWIEYFGELPPAEDGSEFQLTGYLMANAQTFIAAGLLPEEFQELQHGQHRGLEFWMYDQPTDYYRRHLLLHEATHCFMTIVPSPQIPPLWYLEGMAELLGVHQFDEEGRARFAMMPPSSEAVSGFGRVELIQQMIAEGRGLTIEGVSRLGVAEFSESRSEPYAWSWAFCAFLDGHPRYHDRFRQLCLLRDGNELVRQLDASFHDEMAILWIEWELFISQIEYGHQIDRSAIDFRGGRPLAAGASATLEVAADRGWQPTDVRVEAGRAYRITATGEVSLADEPRPWVSTPRGISIRYAHGRPIGRLLAGIVGEGPPGEIGTCGLLHPIEVGEGVEFTASEAGTLYLWINDRWSELDDNRGGYTVTIEGIEG